MEIFTGFIIGLLGSLHCIGMCGPIALALPIGNFKNFKFYFGRIVYNLGRVITYSAFGFVFGIIGKNLAIVGLQRWVSIASGILIMLMVLIPRSEKVFNVSVFKTLTGKIKNVFSDNFTKGSYGSMLFIGIVNGLLPCGFVYVGVAGAIAVGDIGYGVLYMALFGLGTIPVMFATSVAGNFISLNLRQRLSKVLPVFAILLAIVFILRGMNLGIPFISPKTEKMMNANHSEHLNDSGEIKDCCK